MTRAQLAEAEPIIKSVAYRFSGGGLRCGFGVEDLEQEARIALHRESKHFRKRLGSWPAFARVIIFRRISDLTRFNHLREVELNGHDFEIQNDTGLSQETIALISSAVDELPRFQRSIVRLRFGLGPKPPMKIGEIADFVGLHRNTVSPQLRSALAELGQKITRARITD